MTEIGVPPLIGIEGQNGISAALAHVMRLASIEVLLLQDGRLQSICRADPAHILRSALLLARMHSWLDPAHDYVAPGIPALHAMRVAPRTGGGGPLLTVPIVVDGEAIGLVVAEGRGEELTMADAHLAETVVQAWLPLLRGLQRMRG